MDTEPEDWRLYKQPITSAIPYFYRWKINQIKLMLADIEVLVDKHDVAEAVSLYTEVKMEANRLCKQLADSIMNKAKLRDMYEQKKKTVQS